MTPRGLALALALVLAGGAPVWAQTVTIEGGRLDCHSLQSVHYDAPTDRYPHGVLGDQIEWGALRLTYGFVCAGGIDMSPTEVVVTLPDELVFEDLAPRLLPLAFVIPEAHQTDNGPPGVFAVVVESHQRLGARLALWGPFPEFVRDQSFDGSTVRRLAATPFIGQRFRWLAPAAIADLDGDGAIEIAFVDRPHLAKTLRVYRLQVDPSDPLNMELRELASLPGVSNHRIGEDFITGGLRDCGGAPSIILATGDWRRLLSVTFDGTAFTTEDLGPFSAAAVSQALSC